MSKTDFVRSLISRQDVPVSSDTMYKNHWVVLFTDKLNLRGVSLGYSGGC